MTLLFPNLALYAFRFQLALGERRERLPAYLGSTVRGLVAASFRQLVCETQAPVCDGCYLLDRCAYPYIFETPPPAHLSTALQKRFRQAPRPYIVETPPVYRGEAVLDVGLILVGRAIDFLPAFLYVIHEIGKQGLGRAQVPFRLLTVTDDSSPNGVLIYHLDEGVIRDDFQAISIAALDHPEDDCVESISLDFLTPLRVKKFGSYQSNADRLSFAALLDLLLGRLEALALCHCGDDWASHDALRHLSREVETTSQHLTLRRLQRYSNRRKQKLLLDGMVGDISFRGRLDPFLPVLRMGEYVHIGAGTAFGLGGYRLHTAVPHRLLPTQL